MNASGIALVWCGMQVTLIGLLAAGLYLIVRRLRPAAAASVVLTALALVVVLSLLVVSPWPRWTIHQRSARHLGEESELDTAGLDNAPIVTALRSVPGEGQEVAAGGDEVVPTKNQPSVVTLLWQSLLDELAEPQPAVSTNTLRWPAAVALFSLATTTFGLGWLMLGVLSVRGERMRSRPVLDRELLELVDVLRAELACRRPVEVRQSDDLVTAATIGWHRPILLLPNDWTTWTADQRTAVLAHEIAHARSHDFLALLFGQLGLVLHFYHPLLHWLMNRLRLEQELAADAAAASISGGQRNYLATIAELALNQQDPPLLWPARTFLPTQTTFLRRIAMLRDSKLRFDRVSLTARLTAVGMVLLCGLLVAGLRGPGEPTQALAGEPGKAQSDNRGELPRDAKLNTMQRNYRDWTGKTFSGVLDPAPWSNLNTQEKAGVEEKMLKQLASDDQSERITAINALAGLGSKKAVPELLKIAAERVEKDNRDRWMAVRALGILGDPSVVPELVHLTYHYNLNTRLWAQISLVRLTGENFGRDVAAWRQWWEKQGEKPPITEQKVAWATSPEAIQWSDPKKMDEIDRQLATGEPATKAGRNDFVAALTREAETGDYWAEYRLWAAYHKGAIGVPKNPEKAKQWLGKLVEGSYLAMFRPTNGFNPKTPGELLAEFGKHSNLRSEPKGVGGASFFRTRAENGVLIGSFITAYPDKMRKAIADSPSLKLVSIEKLTPEMFARHEASPQESLDANEENKLDVGTAEPATGASAAELKYDDGKPDGKRSFGGSGEMIQFSLPTEKGYIKGIRIHGSRYGLPQPPAEDFMVHVLSADMSDILFTETAPYRLFERGKERWVDVNFKKVREVPKTFWIVLDFKAHQTKGVYVSYDTSTGGKHSKTGLPGQSAEDVNFGGDWMIRVKLANSGVPAAKEAETGAATKKPGR
jgi:hypothetical protein